MGFAALGFFTPQQAYQVRRWIQLDKENRQWLGTPTMHSTVEKTNQCFWYTQRKHTKTKAKLLYMFSSNQNLAEKSPNIAKYGAYYHQLFLSYFCDRSQWLVGIGDTHPNRDEPSTFAKVWRFWFWSITLKTNIYIIYITIYIGSFLNVWTLGGCPLYFIWDISFIIIIPYYMVPLVMRQRWRDGLGWGDVESRISALYGSRLQSGN